MSINNENHLKRNVLEDSSSIKDLECYAGAPNSGLESNYNDNYQEKINEIISALDNVEANTSLYKIESLLTTASVKVRNFMQIICQMITRLHELSDQVALQDKVLGTLLCNETARDDFKDYLNTCSNMDNLRKTELMDLINRISRYTPPKRVEERVDIK